MVSAFITALFNNEKYNIYSKSMLDDSPNYSEIKMTIIYQKKKKKGFICMSFQNLVAAHFAADDDDAP